MGAPDDQPSAPQPPPPAKRPKRRIRNFLLEPRFQLRYASLLAGVSLAIFAILGAVLLRTGRTTAEVSNEAVDLAGIAEDQSDRALRESQASARILRLQHLAESGGDPAVARVMERELEAVDAEGRTALRGIQRQRELTRAKRAQIDRLQHRIVLAIVLAGLVLGLSLFGVGIVLSHRIVGPKFRLRQLFWKVSRGDLEITERLRPGDELVDLFEAFKTMVAALRAHQAEEIVAMEEALRALEADHPESDAVARLRAAVERMRKRRGTQDREAFSRPS